MVETRRGDRAGNARLLLVDDHDLARAGLRSMLTGERGLEVIGEARNGKEARAQCRRLRPDLVLMDVRMPELDGLAATAAIKRECRDVKIIIVTMHENADYLMEAMKAGAIGYILKDATHREVVMAVRQALRGECTLNARLATAAVQRLATDTRPRTGPAGEKLTPRESEVLRLLARGQTNREIAESLFISPGTAKVHVERIIAKLGASSRTQAAVQAMELGLVSPSL